MGSVSTSTTGTYKMKSTWVIRLKIKQKMIPYIWLCSPQACSNSNNELYDANTPKDKLATSAKSLTIKIIMISYKFKLNVISE